MFIKTGNDDKAKILSVYQLSDEEKKELEAKKAKENKEKSGK